MLLIINVVLTVMGILFNKSKGWFYVITYWSWILLGFCSDMTRLDYANYLIFYDRVDNMHMLDFSGTEPGYFLLCKFFHFLNLSFDEAYKIMVLFIIFSVAYVICRNTKRICLPMILFLWYPAIMSAYNTREGIAMSIIIIAIQVLLNDKKNCLLKYVILVLIASSIHTSAFIYLVFIILKLWNKLSKKKIMLFTIFGVILMLGIDNFSIIQTLLGSRRFSYYFSIRHTDNITAILAILWQFSICFIIFFLMHIRTNEQKHMCIQISLDDLEQEKYFDYIEKIFLLILILCPMYFFTFTYIRLVRNILIFVYIYYAKWKELPNTGLKKLKKIVFFIWSGLTIYGLNIVVKKDFEDVIKVFFNYNNYLQVIYDNIFFTALFIFLIIKGFMMDYIWLNRRIRV